MLNAALVGQRAVGRRMASCHGHGHGTLSDEASEQHVRVHVGRVKALRLGWRMYESALWLVRTLVS